MKTFTQFTEDVNRLEQRRQKLRQRQLSQMQASKEKVSEYQASQKEKRRAAAERESLKKEIKRELQTEQTPVMQPNLYSKQVAMRQGAQKSAQIRHVHSELGAEARVQQAAKRARMKEIMSR